MSLIAFHRRAAPIAALTLGGFFLSLFPAGRAMAQQADPAGGSTASMPELESEANVSVAATASGPSSTSSIPSAQSSIDDTVLSKRTATDPAPATSVPATATSPVPATASTVAQPPAVPRALPTGPDKSGVTSRTISVPKGAGTIKGMEESFSAQLSTGIATLNVPFALPAARGDAQPALGLSYSSSGGAGIAGMGWEVGVPFIARQTDRGIPKYGDDVPRPGGRPSSAREWFPEQDRFVFNGGQELVPICVVSPSRTCTGALSNVQLLPEGSTPVSEVMPIWSAGWQYLRPRVEGSFMRFFWSPDGRTWRVQDKSGTTMELGVPLNDKSYADALETNPDDPSEIYRWHVVRQYDAYGNANPQTGAPQPVNVVVFRYRKDGGMAYLSDIFDTPPAVNAAAASLDTYAHHTHLEYEDRTDPTSSYRSGWRIDQRLRLARVDVASKTFNGSPGDQREILRKYRLSYDPQFHVSLLKQVQVEGRCAGGSCPSLPPMTFEYNHVEPFTSTGAAGVRALAGYEGFDERVHEMTASPPHSVEDEYVDLFDFNSDALPDVLVTTPGAYGSNHGLFFNGAGGLLNNFGSVATVGVKSTANVSPSNITLNNPNVAAFDADGDGVVNLVHMPELGKFAFYRPDADAKGYFWSGQEIGVARGQSPKLDLGKDAFETEVVDVNFDGLVDVVRTTGDEIQTFFALGRYPKGNGQFGQATQTGATTATISTEPVRTCVPQSGKPVLFSDSENKLAEMNGDGIADIVRVTRGNIIYWPGRGNAFWGTGKRNDCPPGGFAAGRHIAMGSSPSYSDIEGRTLRLDDVNGDGLDDLVQINFDTIAIWLNVDGTSWTERQTLINTKASPFDAKRVRLVDINGSGTKDILWGHSGKYTYIDLAGGERPWVLTQFANGLGKTTTLEYSTSSAEMLEAQRTGRPCISSDPWSGAWCVTTPNVVHVVKRVTESDHQTLTGPAPPLVTEYGYRDALYDGYQREFRGFGRARARRVGDANSPTDITETAFLLGHCEDEDAEDGVDSCADLSAENPREALKGLPALTERFDEQGQYLSTEHTTYRLRQLYTGLDGRAVRHALEVKARRHLYDTATPPPPAASALGLLELHAASVETERTLGSVVQAAPLPIPLRKPAGAAVIENGSIVDPFGNTIDAVAYGCTGGEACPNADETITTRTEPTLVDGNASAWIWRTVKSYTTGRAAFGAAHGIRRNEAATSYNVQGDAIETRGVLAGTLGLLRSTSPSGAPDPGEASADATNLLLGIQRYDQFGNLESEAGPNGRCRSFGYDEQYQQLPIRETVHAGEYDRTAAVGAAGSCGALQLHTTAMYDRGLELVVQAIDVQGRITKITYDGLGRFKTLTPPRPGPDPPPNPSDQNFIPGLSVNPSIVVNYLLPPENGPGAAHSIIHSLVQDGESHEDAANYLEASTYIDGFGRTMFTLREGDPELDGFTILSDGVYFDAKGAVREKFNDLFFGGPEEAVSAKQRYDAFGRTIELRDLDDTVTLRSDYHALSVDNYDAADLTLPEHQGTPATERKDGHGRSFYSIERYKVNGADEARATRTGHLPSGEVEFVNRLRFAGGIAIGRADIPDGSGAAESVFRWMRYDSLGRMVLNVEPNTSPDFTSNKDAPAAGLRAWRYKYNNAGDLVGTSDARGCGVNYRYDAAGRLLLEDYSPCVAGVHPAYSGPNLGAGTGLEVVYFYDGNFGGALPAWASLPPGYNIGAASLKGRPTAVFDRGSATFSTYNGRGQLERTDTRIAKPSSKASALPGASHDNMAQRYAPRWYVQKFGYDAADREVVATTGARTPALLGTPLGGNTLPAETSAVRTQYSRRGTVKAVDGSYGPLIRKILRAGDGLPTRIVYGDAAHTTADPGTRTHYTYDGRRRLRTIDTWRDAPSAWSNPASYTPSPSPGGTPTSFQLTLQDDEILYDVVSNPTVIRDWRNEAEWPAGAKPVRRNIQYDNLYRIKRVDHTYFPAADSWTTPFEAENAGTSPDPRRADPSPQVSFSQRVLWQTFEYDWLGNTAVTEDDARGFYDRSLGTIVNGTSTAGPYQLKTASNFNPSPPQHPSRGSALLAYDIAGNVTRLNVRRHGPCIPTSLCSMRFAYVWDEVGRLIRAQRWDVDTAAIAQPTDPLPAVPPNADLVYLYDAGDERVVKSASLTDRHTVYVFESLNLRQATWIPDPANGSALDYELGENTEVPYLSAGGEKLARVVLEAPGDGEPRVGGSRRHVFFELGDQLGSTSVVIDQATGELVERSTYQTYGGVESDYRPARWKHFREDYRFTGKEEDVEVGLQYFGKRFYAPLLQRWVSPDPLEVHAARQSGDLNLYAYVSGRALKNVDPLGLCGQDAAGAGGTCGKANLGAQGTSSKDAYGTPDKNAGVGFDMHDPAKARLAGIGMGTTAALLPVAGEALLLTAMHDLRGKLDADVYNAWLEGVAAGAEATAITALATAKTSAVLGVASAPKTGGTGTLVGGGVAVNALTIAGNAQVIVVMAMSDYGKARTIAKNQKDGARRERLVQAELQKKSPRASVQKEQYLRDKNGQIVYDEVTGEGRRIDHVVIEKAKNGKKKATAYETTSETADKTDQLAKEQRIRKQGGTFVRDREDGSLVPVPQLSQVLRRP